MPPPSSPEYAAEKKIHLNLFNPPQHPYHAILLIPHLLLMLIPKISFGWSSG